MHNAMVDLDDLFRSRFPSNTVDFFPRLFNDFLDQARVM
jgi:hypothetical protein